MCLPIVRITLMKIINQSEDWFPKRGGNHHANSGLMCVDSGQYSTCNKIYFQKERKPSKEKQAQQPHALNEIVKWSKWSDDQWGPVFVVWSEASIKFHTPTYLKLFLKLFRLNTFSVNISSVPKCSLLTTECWTKTFVVNFQLHQGLKLISFSFSLQSVTFSSNWADSKPNSQKSASLSWSSPL